MAIHKVAGLVQNGFIAGLTVPAHKNKLFKNKRTAKKAGAFTLRTVVRVGNHPHFFSWVDKEGFKVVL